MKWTERTGPEASSRSSPSHASGAGGAGETRLVAWILAAACLLLFTALRQTSFWGDGRILIEFTRQEGWSHSHLAYPVLAHLAITLCAPFFGSDPVPALIGLSVVSASTACAFTYLAARAVGCGQVASISGALLLVLAPSVFFFGTCIELHAPQVAAAAGAVLWITRARRSERLGASAWPPALLLAALATTHLTGILWAPSLAVLAYARGWRRPPRHRIVACLPLLLLGAIWFYLRHDESSGGDHIRTGIGAVLASAWHPFLLQRELFAPGGLLYGVAILALAAAWFAARRARSRGLSRPGMPCDRAVVFAGAVLFASYLPFAATVNISERGAYFISLLPVLAVVSATLLDRLPGRWKLACVPLVAAQAALAIPPQRDWNVHYEGVEWIAPLQAETDGHGVVHVLAWDEAASIYLHSRLDPLWLGMGRPLDLPPPARTVDTALWFTQVAVNEGRAVALTRTLYTTDRAPYPELVRRLIETYGEPQPSPWNEILYLRAPTPADG